MTAYGFEIEFAKSEGVEFRHHVVPKRIVVENGRVRGLELLRTELDDSARPVAGSESMIPVDTVILAIGQSKFVKLLESFEIQHDHGIAVVDDAMRTNRPGIFAAGDCMFRAGTSDAMVVEAAQRGKQAARSIDAYVREAVR
jgi:glutamate synthase (NADPH/NADH) small chain